MRYNLISYVLVRDKMWDQVKVRLRHELVMVKVGVKVLVTLSGMRRFSVCWPWEINAKSIRIVTQACV